MVRDTSKLAFRKVSDSGLLSRKRLEVFTIVYKYGPCTSAEAYVKMGQTGTAVLTQSRARFTECREWGVIKEVGQRKCTVTGHEAIVWDITDKMPVKPEKDLQTDVDRILRHIIKLGKKLVKDERKSELREIYRQMRGFSGRLNENEMIQK